MSTHPDFPRARVYINSRSKFLYLEYDCPLTGRRLRESSGQETETGAWAELRKRLRANHDPSWKEIVVHFFTLRERDLKPTTMHQYANSVRALDPYFGPLMLSEISSQSIKKFVADRRKHVTDASVRRDLATASTIFSTAQLTLPKVVPEVNPFRIYSKRHLREVKRTRFLTEDEFKRLDAAMTTELHRVLLQVFVMTGMRHGEVLALRWDWIKWEVGEFGEIQLPREVNKNDKLRIIPLFPSLRRILEDWYARRPGEHVFTHWSEEEKAWVPYTTFSPWWTRARVRAGVKDVRIHDLRHTFASWWVQRGGHMAALKEMLGHADMRMVGRYAHLNSESQHRAMKEIADKF